MDDVLAHARGETSIRRGADGSVFIYDDQRALVPPRTVRVCVTPDGCREVDSFSYGA